jgi:hypothetical protein
MRVKEGKYKQKNKALRPYLRQLPEEMEEIEAKGPHPNPSPPAGGEGTGRSKRRLCFAKKIAVTLLMNNGIKMMWKK